MKILIAAIGKARKDAKNDLYQDYIKRLPWKVECRQLQKNQQLLAACAGYECIIALDESGENISSQEFAEKLGKWQQSGISSFVFLIGGADGLDDSIRKKAQLVWSFGRVTWPHMLVRALLAEQLYRAFSLLSGHPYHRE